MSFINKESELYQDVVEVSPRFNDAIRHPIGEDLLQRRLDLRIKSVMKYRKFETPDGALQYIIETDNNFASRLGYPLLLPKDKKRFFI